jgi:hypothetical protein
MPMRRKIRDLSFGCWLPWIASSPRTRPRYMWYHYTIGNWVLSRRNEIVPSGAPISKMNTYQHVSNPSILNYRSFFGFFRSIIFAMHIYIHYVKIGNKIYGSMDLEYQNDQQFVTDRVQLYIHYVKIGNKFYESRKLKRSTICNKQSTP